MCQALKIQTRNIQEREVTGEEAHKLMIFCDVAVVMCDMYKFLEVFVIESVLE